MASTNPPSANSNATAVSVKPDEPSITLYTGTSPNGNKISILLEELGLQYRVRVINIREREQKSNWFLSINPNGRIPAITDKLPDGTEIRVFESGSIMQYLVDRYDAEQQRVSYPRGSREWVETNSWLFFQNAGVGPMQGQANHFNRYAGEKIPYAIDRYITETSRLYSIIDTHLRTTGGPYMVGAKCTIADMALYGWLALAQWAGVDIDNFPAIKAWDVRMLARPGVERGRHVPERDLREVFSDPERMKYIQNAGKEVNAEQNQRDRDDVAAYAKDKKEEEK